MRNGEQPSVEQSEYTRLWIKLAVLDEFHGASKPLTVVISIVSDYRSP